MLGVRSGLLSNLLALLNDLPRCSFHTSSCVYLTHRKWKLPGKKPTVVEPKLLKFNQPVSASSVFNEDLAEINSRKFEFDVDSLTKRGFLRFQKEYQPPPNAIAEVLELVKSLNPKLSTISDLDIVDYELSNPRFKYDLLVEAHKKFNYAVPNSMLYMIVSIRELCKFYNTPVSTATPYDDLQKVKDLPQNLYIQQQAVRFDPATDTRFGDKTPFPRSSTIVTGLRAKKKYKTIHAERRVIPTISS